VLGVWNICDNTELCGRWTVFLEHVMHESTYQTFSRDDRWFVDMHHNQQAVCTQAWMWTLNH
jgi:hypothetical protein